MYCRREIRYCSGGEVGIRGRLLIEFESEVSHQFISLFTVCSLLLCSSGCVWNNVSKYEIFFFSSLVGWPCNNNGVFGRIYSETSRMSLQVALEPQVVGPCATGASFELPYLTPVECSIFSHFSRGEEHDSSFFYAFHAFSGEGNSKLPSTRFNYLRYRYGWGEKLGGKHR